MFICNSYPHFIFLEEELMKDSRDIKIIVTECEGDSSSDPMYKEFVFLMKDILIEIKNHNNEK